MSEKSIQKVLLQLRNQLPNIGKLRRFEFDIKRYNQIQQILEKYSFLAPQKKKPEL